jgi:hypothetical protein
MIEKVGDLVSYLTVTASQFAEKTKHKNADKVLADYINFVAAQHCMDYGIWAEEIKLAKKRKPTPVDVDVMIELNKKVEECRMILVTIYMNYRTVLPHVEAQIEHFAEHDPELKRRIAIYQE